MQECRARGAALASNGDQAVSQAIHEQPKVAAWGGCGVHTEPGQ